MYTSVDPLKSQGVFRFFIYIRGAGSTREVWGDPSPCVGPAARDAMLLMKEAMLLTAETGKQVMVCWRR